MTTTVWPNGIGGDTGDVLGTCKPLITSGTIWYVDSVTGADEETGSDEHRPKATLASALGSASGNDIIVLLATHSETITSQLTPTTGQTIVGLGSAAGKPTAKLIKGYDGPIFNLSNAGVRIRNIYFSASTVATVASRIITGNVGQVVSSCYFEMDGNDQYGGSGASAIYLNTTTSQFRCEDCTVVSTAAATGAQPYTGFRLGAAISDIDFVGLTVDGGASGWANPYAIDLSGFAITRFRAENLSLLRGSDMRLNASTTGYVNPQTTTGSSKALW